MITEPLHIAPTLALSGLHVAENFTLNTHALIEGVITFDFY